MRKPVPTVLLWAVPTVLLTASLCLVASGILWAGPPAGGSGLAAAAVGQALALQASAEPVEPADNSYCLVCHTNYEEEKLTKRHQLHGVGCEKCHGPSVKHSGDEDGLTPPDIMYAKANVNAMCMKCHAGEKMAAADGHQDVFVNGGVEGNCSDCHGKKHRMKVRTRIWDKTTRKLVKDDGVRMMLKDSPATAGAAPKSKHGAAAEP